MSSPLPLRPPRPGRFGRPTGQLVPTAVPVVSGLVPEAIELFLAASRTEWQQVSPSAHRPPSTNREVREGGPGTRAFRSTFPPDDARLAFFDAVDAPIAEAVADIPTDEADAPLTDRSHAPTMTLLRALPVPRKVVPLPRDAEEARAGWPARGRPAVSDRRATARPRAGAAPLALAASAMFLLAGAGVVHSSLTGVTGNTRAHAPLPGLPDPPHTTGGPLRAFADLLGEIWTPSAPAELQEVATPSGEMVELASGHGVVEVVIDGDADVWIDGAPRGVVQQSGLFSLPTGDHEFELRVGSSRELRTVAVDEGAAVRLELADERAGLAAAL